MGRAILIICAGVLLGLSYTFFGMNNRSLSMTQGNVNSYKAIKAKNMAQTGVQLAIEEYNDRKSDKEDTNDEFKNVTRNIDDTNLTLSLDERVEMIDDESTDVIVITSASNYQGTEHKTVATFDVSENQQLVPTFKSAIDLALDNFNFDQKGSALVTGQSPNSTCKDAPGISVKTESHKSTILNSIKNNDIINLPGDILGGGEEGDNEEDSDTEEENNNGKGNNKSKNQGNNNGNDNGGGGAKKGIVGSPAVNADETLDFKPASDFLKMLEGENYTVINNKSFSSEPSVYVVEENSDGHITGGNGYGVIVVKEGGFLHINGNASFDGIMIFEDGYKLKGNGTFDMNGSVIVGSPDGNSSNVDINGNITFQYDCTAQKYADEAVEKVLNTTLYQLLSIYE